MAREQSVDEAQAEANKHYQQYYGHLDRAEEERRQKEKERLEQEAKERAEAPEPAEHVTEEPALEITGAQGVTPDGLDFAPNDFLKSLIDEVYFGDGDDDSLTSTSQTVDELVPSTSEKGGPKLPSAESAQLLVDRKRRKKKREMIERKSLQLYRKEMDKIRRYARVVVSCSTCEDLLSYMIVRDFFVMLFLCRKDYKAMLRQREGLPCYQRKDHILDLIRNNRVIVLSGETGCGKTTQLPQMVLEDMMRNKIGARCNIICTQPRRISAIGVSERVADE